MKKEVEDAAATASGAHQDVLDEHSDKAADLTRRLAEATHRADVEAHLREAAEVKAEKLEAELLASKMEAAEDTTPDPARHDNAPSKIPITLGSV